MKKIPAISVILFATILFAGCFRTIKTDDGTVKVKDNIVEVKGKDGSQTNIASSDDKGSVDLPEGYPKDIVPIMDGGKVTLSSRNQDSEKRYVYTVSFEHKSQMKEASKYYQEVMKDAEDKYEATDSSTFTIVGTKDKNKVIILVSDSPTDTNMKSVINIVIEKMTE